MIFYLFRHGQTYFSKNHLQYKDKNDTAEILKEGIYQIKDIANKLKSEGIKQIYSSPIKRCVQTVNIVQKEVPNIKVDFDQRIKEQEVTTGGETFDDQTKRIKDFLDEIKNKDYEKVGICSHGWPIAVMIRLLKGKKVHRINLIKYPKCGKIIIIDSKLT